MNARFFYDIVCPYAYLASTQIEKLALETGATIEWVPMLLGGVFRAHEAPQVPAEHMSPPKAEMNVIDLQRWAKRWNVPFQFSSHHPQRSVEAMRFLCVTPPDLRPQVSAALFKAYWVDQRILDQALIDEIAGHFGLTEVWTSQRALAKSRLFENTELAVQFGVFGAPAIEIEGEIFWGQDRLELARVKLGSTLEPITEGQAPEGTYVELYHDFASPFSYLGCQYAAHLIEARGAQLVWRPILLGALFRALKGPIVPLFEMSKAKQRYMLKDLGDWAERWGKPFKFPQGFPMNTVTALRLAIVEPTLTLPLYHAAWGEGLDLSKEETLHQVMHAQGYSSERLFAQAQEPEVKQQLRDNTLAAEQIKAFGVPSYVLHRPDEPPQLFWGQDRLRLLCEAIVV